MEENSSREFKCTSCGAFLEYAPGIEKLKCSFCGATNEITVSEQEVQELSLEEWLEKSASETETEEHTSITCTTCGAISNIDNTSLSHCPFCGLQLMGDAKPLRLVKPKGMLPFKINQKQATDGFRKWINGLFLAPNKLKRFAEHDSSIKGVYIPYWTFDSSAVTSYEGQKGTTVRGNKSTTIHWTDVSGQVENTFDDILIPAAQSLPPKLLKYLEPWHLEELTPYQEEFLSGFQSEAYSIDLQEGYKISKRKMEEIIKATIKRDIRGDRQKITSMSPVFSPFSFKHILLPIWISSYKFNDKTFRYLVNGRTGEVQGERPWSPWKVAALITFLVIFASIFGYVVINGR